MDLRPLGAHDVDHLIALDSDPAVLRYINGGTPCPPDVVREHLLPRMLSWAGPGVGFFAIEREGEFLGWAHLRPDRVEPAWIEVGYRLHRRFWGQGVATDATRRLIRQAFDLGHGVVSARTMHDNLASRRVMEKCGMALRGAFRFPATAFGDWVVPEADCVVYTIERPRNYPLPS